MGSLSLAACFLVYEDADLRQNVDGKLSPLRWRALTPSRLSRPRSRTRRASPLTSSVSSLRASSSRMAAPFRTTTSRRSPPFTWCSVSVVLCTQVQPMEEVHCQDALEVEEEAYASSPEEASQDASTLQVNHHIPSKSSVMPHQGLAACCVCN